MHSKAGNDRLRTYAFTKELSTGSSWPHCDGHRRSRRWLEGYTSVCSAISRASSTSIPRYRTVLSSFVWPSRS